MRFTAAVFFASLLAIGQGSTPSARLQYLSKSIKALAPMITSSTEATPGSRESLIESATRFAFDESSEVETFIQALRSVRDGHLSVAEVDGAMWEVVTTLYNRPVEEVTTTTTTSTPPPSLEVEPVAGKRSVFTFDSPSSRVKRFRFSPSHEGERFKERLRAYFEATPASTQVTEGHRYLNYSHLKMAEKGQFDKLTKNLDLIESLGCRHMHIYFEKAYALLTTGSVELTAEEEATYVRIASRTEAHFARTATPESIKEHLAWVFRDQGEIHRPFGPFVGLEADLYKKATRDFKWQSLQYFLDYLEVLGVGDAKIRTLFHRVYQHLQQPNTQS